MPLVSIHPNARPAAIASMAAHKQGKFWKYHDRLFKNSKKLGRDDLITWAKVEGLDIERFKTDMSAPDIAEQLLIDAKDAQKAGVRGTPTTFINGRKLKTPPTNADAILDVVNSEILKK